MGIHKCTKCGRFLSNTDEELHFECHNCDWYYCFEKGCHCCDGILDDIKAQEEADGDD